MIVRLVASLLLICEDVVECYRIFNFRFSFSALIDTQLKQYVFKLSC